MASTVLLFNTDLNHSWLHRWIYSLAAGFIFTAVALRTFLVFGYSTDSRKILALLATWLLAFVLGSLSVRGLTWVPPVMIAVELFTCLIMLYFTRSDFFACLFLLVGMQSMRHYSAWIAGTLLSLSMLLTFLILEESYGKSEALALALVYTAGGAFIAAYIASTRQARTIQVEQQALMTELQEANHKLESLAFQQQQLAEGRERARLARELHDSVTQTIFSMTLTTQSALLLEKRDPKQVSIQLDRLDQLTRNAMAEMQVLISRLTPEPAVDQGFVSALQQHLAKRRQLDNLFVSFEVIGCQSLSPTEEAGLFRIAQEALNNIIKHAGTLQGVLQLHLEEPFWMELTDSGAGFDQEQINSEGRMGIAGMRERATEIDWSLEVISAPGKGTKIRVQKNQGRGQRIAWQI